MEKTLMLTVSPFFSPFSSQRARQSQRGSNFYILRAMCQKVMQLRHLKDKNLEDTEFEAIVRSYKYYKIPNLAQKLQYDLKSQGTKPGVATLSALLLSHIENGLINEAQTLWDEIINSLTVSNAEVISCLVDVHVRTGYFGEVLRLLDETASMGLSFTSQLYSAAVTCFGRAGRLEMMELVVKDMVSRGLKVDSVTGNDFVKYYSIYGSVEGMEAAYKRMKKSRILIEEDAIRAMALTYISQRKFYRLGEFLRDVGLRRTNTGNLIWNLMLLSFAANFKMKSLQREFLAMLDAGFSPDLTTFNIRAIAFSRMHLFWDLHLSIEHMNYKGVVPDLVTYGCFVDAYLDRRLGRNLSFVLNKMNVQSSPKILTDPFIFEALGKGDFHSTSESLLEVKTIRKWTYSKLIAVYLRKQYRSNQIFWNY